MRRAARTTRLAEEPDYDFDHAATKVHQHFAAVLGTPPRPLFRVKVGRHELYEAYLAGFPTEALRQHHTCSCCRQFIGRFGNLAVVDEGGVLVSALWGSGHVEPYAAPIAAMRKIVERGRIHDVFLSDEAMWGAPVSPVTGNRTWTHFAIEPPAAALRRKHGILTPGQQMAEKREDYRILQTALAEIKREHVEQALTLLRSDALYRSEKVIGPAEFLLRMHDLRTEWRGRARDNLTWLAVATAPTGFCKPRGAMIGTLLEDIAAGSFGFDEIKARFAAKMHPLRYQRPTAAPSRGTIEQAEKLVAELGLEPALHRRFARIEDVEPHLLWKPTPPAAKPNGGGVFGHLTDKEGERAKVDPILADAQKITWAKFASKVLPSALQAHVYMGGVMPFFGMTTATNIDAPPILQWDTAETRNPVAWYFYNGGSAPRQWGMEQGTWAPVAGIVIQPSMWSGNLVHQGNGGFLIIEGARDQRMIGSGNNLCLFPEILRTDLHAVRSVIEAYSRTRAITDAENGTANGVAVPHNGVQVRVTTSIGVETYVIDRWD